MFNPIRGFRWLTEMDGHWNYMTMIKGKPSIDGQSTGTGGAKTIATYMGKDFRLFNQGIARVTYVLGEFYWRVQVGEEVLVEDYIHPPQILSCEKNKEEIVWSEGEYVTADEIKTAFQIETPMPTPMGVAPNQPPTLTPAGLGKYWVIFSLILLLIQIVNLVQAKQEQVYQGDFVYQSTDTEKIKISPSFELKHGISNLDIHLYSPVKNSWLEVEGSLVNDQTGATYEWNQGVEYYLGFDSDGDWSSGEQNNHVLLSSIPAGTYHLNLEPSFGKETSAFENLPLPFTGSLPEITPVPKPPMEQKYTMTLTRGIETWSNFFLTLGLLSVFPLVVWIFRRAFEYSRWSKSDLSPSQFGQEEPEEEREE